jgi:hypothetical protein
LGISSCVDYSESKCDAEGCSRKIDDANAATEGESSDLPACGTYRDRLAKDLPYGELRSRAQKKRRHYWINIRSKRNRYQQYFCGRNRLRGSQFYLAWAQQVFCGSKVRGGRPSYGK